MKLPSRRHTVTNGSYLILYLYGTTLDLHRPEEYRDETEISSLLKFCDEESGNSNSSLLFPLGIEIPIKVINFRLRSPIRILGLSELQSDSSLRYRRFECDVGTVDQWDKK